MLCTLYSLNYLRGARVIFEYVSRALPDIHEKDLKMPPETNSKEFTYLSGQLLSLPNKKQSKDIKDNFEKLVEAKYFSDTFRGYTGKKSGDSKVVTIKGRELTRCGSEFIVFIGWSMVKLTSENGNLVTNNNIPKDFDDAREPEEKWKVLYNIREWRNNKLGHRLASEGVCITDEDLRQLYDWAELFYELFGLDDSYHRELLEIKQSNFIDSVGTYILILEYNNMLYGYQYKRQ